MVEGLFEAYWYGEQCEMQNLKKNKNGGLWGPTPHFVPFPKFRMENTYFGKTFLKIKL